MTDRARANTLILMGALMTFVAPPAMLIDGHQKAHKASVLNAEGRKIKANVDRVDEYLRRDDQIEYSFVADGRTVRVTEDVTRNISEAAQAEGSVKVVYSPHDPQIATADLERMQRSGQNLTSWGPLFVAFLGITFASFGFGIRQGQTKRYDE